MPNKLPKGSSFKLVKTAGRDSGNYDLYELRGLSLGKLSCIQHALTMYGGTIAEEILATIGPLDENQTINGK